MIPPLRALKSRAQFLPPRVRLGKAGVDAQFLAEIETALDRDHLVKIRFEAHKEERKELSALIVGKTGALRVLQVGHTLTLYRHPTPKAEPGHPIK